jgi:hypothetical protein
LLGGSAKPIGGSAFFRAARSGTLPSGGVASVLRIPAISTGSRETAHSAAGASTASRPTLAPIDHLAHPIDVAPSE